MRDLIRFINRFRITFLFILLQLLSLFLVFSNNHYQRTWWFGTMSEASNGLMEMRSTITDYARLDDQNADLAAQIDSLLSLHKSAYASVESKYVKIQDTIFQQRYRYLNAKVINNTTGRQNNYITLNKGSKAGVQVDMGVVGPHGIVGKIVQVSENYSTAMSVLHRKFTVSVRSKESGHKGFLNWNTGNSQTVTIEDVARHAPIKQGDTFIARGSAGTFPEGVIIGEVSQVHVKEGSNYHDIEVTLSTDFEALGHVQIVMDLMRAEQLELEELTEELHDADGAN